MGIQNMANGKAGEYRVASELLLKGYDVFMPSVDNGIDLLLGNGRCVQVKSSCSDRFMFNSAKSKKAGIKYGEKVEPYLAEGVDIVVLWSVLANEFHILSLSDIKETPNICAWTSEKYLDNWTILGNPDKECVDGSMLGKAGEYRVISELLSHGYDVFQPVIDNGADLYIAGSKSIQVKTSQRTIRRKPYKHSAYQFNFFKAIAKSRGNKLHDENGHVVAHSLLGVDFVILYAVGDDEFYIIPASEIKGKVTVSFTADHDKRTQTKWNRWLPYKNNWAVLDGQLPEVKEQKEFECKQCGYKWESRVENPTRCPRCHARWHIKREREIIDGKVVPLTQEERNQINKVECVRSRWAKAKGKSIEEIESHQELTCKQCGYTWLPIRDNPQICPHCYGAWYLDRKRKIVDGKIVPWTNEELRVISSQNSNRRWEKERAKQLVSVG